jgi:hypothetical protein
MTGVDACGTNAPLARATLRVTIGAITMARGRRSVRAAVLLSCRHRYRDRGDAMNPEGGRLMSDRTIPELWEWAEYY